MEKSKTQINVWRVTSVIMAILLICVSGAFILNLKTQNKTELPKPEIYTVQKTKTEPTIVPIEETAEDTGGNISWEDCSENPESKMLETIPVKCIAPDGHTAIQP